MRSTRVSAVVLGWLYFLGAGCAQGATRVNHDDLPATGIDSGTQAPTRDAGTGDVKPDAGSLAEPDGGKPASGGGDHEADAGVTTQDASVTPREDAGSVVSDPCAALDCDDGEPCTNDSCVDGECVHTDNALPCEDDGDPCTSDVCRMGRCSHPANGTCACTRDSQCDDGDPCTDQACVNGECVYTNNEAPCDDDGNLCTDNVCKDGRCIAVNNSARCESDNSACTDDICVDGACAHIDNGTCECLRDEDCDDNNECTNDRCNAAGTCVHENRTGSCTDDGDTCTCDVCSNGQCTHPSKDECAVGTPTVINNFNSTADFWANRTTPHGLPITATDFNGLNLEADAVLYMAEDYQATLEMGVPELSGLTNLVIRIQSLQPDTASMIYVGLQTTPSSSWVTKRLSQYGSVAQGTYTAITVPLRDFGLSLCRVKKLRLSFQVTGGEKTWRLDDISAN